jgi:hypothetical protein
MFYWFLPPLLATMRIKAQRSAIIRYYLQANAINAPVRYQAVSFATHHIYPHDFTP